MAISRPERGIHMVNPVVHAILERRSIRSYQNQQISPEQLKTLMDVAVASPSARNTQPWHFSFVQNKALLSEISQAVAQALDNPGFDVFYQAPTVVFLSRSTTENQAYGAIDCGIAVENLAIAAHGMGLGSVILGLPRAAFTSPRAEEFRKALRFPEGYDFTIAIAIGYAAASKEAHPVDAGKVDLIC